MKNKLIAVLAAFGLVASASAVKINDNISINGFIDGSYSNVDADGAATMDETNVGIDEVEVNILVNAGNVSGELHLDTEDADDDQGISLEQVHFSYGFANGLTATAGRFGSSLGFEREDPAGLYTFSRAYDNAFDLGDVDSRGAQEGIRLGYSAGDFSFSASVFNPVGTVEETNDNNGDAAGTDTSEDNLDYEIAVAFNGLDNLVIGGGFQVANGVSTNGGASTDTTITNLHAAYTLNKLLIGAEYVNIDVDLAGDTSAYLLLADYDINNKAGIAVRYSEWETNAAGAETNKLSIAPNYAITDSLGAILEWASTDTGAAQDEDQLAIELTYTF